MKKIVLILLGMFSISAIAQDQVKKWSGESELSFVKTSGNSVSDSLFAKQSVVYDSRPWRNTLKLEATNVSSEALDSLTGKKESVRTGEKYYLTDQLDRYLSKVAYAFLRFTREKDRFSSFDHQTTEVLGYGHSFIDTDAFNLKGEVGLGHSTQEWLPCSASSCDPDVDYGKTIGSQLIYLSESFLWKINKTAEIGQDVSVEETSDNRVTRFHAYVKSQLVSSLAMKMGYQMRHVDQVADDKKHKDQEITASLIYSF